MATPRQAFTNRKFGTIRTITSGGQILFCGKDVATTLGYTNPNKALQDHCKGGSVSLPLETSGGVQHVSFISEGDLYRLISSFKLPAAQDFEAWVVDEVLPTIRRHGVYAIDELLDDDEFLERAIIQFRSERAKRLAAEQALLEAAPKVSFYDIVLQSDSPLTTTEIAKDYGLLEKKLNLLLHDAGVQFRQPGHWFLYAHRATRSRNLTSTTRAKSKRTCTGRRRVACSPTIC